MLCLERRLSDLDAKDYAEEPYILASRSYDEEESPKRRELIVELKFKMKEYDELLIREHHLLKTDQPSRKKHRNYFDYIWNEKPLCPEEYDYVFYQDDMVSLGTDSEDSWLEPVMDTVISLIPAKI